MPVNQDPDFFKILLGVITFLFGILDVVAMNILSELKQTDRDILKKVDDHEKRLSTLEGEHKVRSCK
jgi:hypothetical protein